MINHGDHGDHDDHDDDDDGNEHDDDEDDDDDGDDDDDMTQFDYWVSSKRWKNNFLLIRDIRQCFIYLYFVTPVSIMI